MILVFTGHMIDAPGCLVPRYPPWLEQHVAAAIRQEVAALDPSIGFAPAACGADIQFLEALRDSGREYRVVLPFPRDDFLRTSVAFGGTHWVRRYEALTGNGQPVTELTDDPYLGEDELYSYGFEIMLGMALNERAKRQEDVRVLAVLDEGADSLVGGTKHVLERLSGRSVEVVSIRVSELRERHAGEAKDYAIPTDRSSEPSTRFLNAPEDLLYERSVRSMLFADVKGFSGMREIDSPAFFVHFLNAVAAAIGDRPENARPVFQNTWGDGLFLVFERIVDAARLALDLRDAVRRKDWTRHGLPRDLALRIGLHAGPVFAARDPIIDRINFFGGHVNRAARIEPIVEANDVWCSEQFAALLRSRLVPGFGLEELGRRQLAKNSSEAQLFRLIRA